MKNKWNYIPIIFIVFGLFLVLMANRKADLGHRTGIENQAYLRAMYCFGTYTSKPVGEREPGYVQKCIKAAEQATGVKLDTFGNE